jgi:hypothetical protein
VPSLQQLDAIPKLLFNALLEIQSMITGSFNQQCGFAWFNTPIARTMLVLNVMFFQLLRSGRSDHMQVLKRSVVQGGVLVASPASAAVPPPARGGSADQQHVAADQQHGGVLAAPEVGGGSGSGGGSGGTAAGSVLEGRGSEVMAGPVACIAVHGAGAALRLEGCQVGRKERGGVGVGWVRARGCGLWMPPTLALQDKTGLTNSLLALACLWGLCLEHTNSYSVLCSLG